MKKILILCSFVFATGLVSAQSDANVKTACCKKSSAQCAKSKTASASTEVDSETKVASAMTSADIAAEKDESIIRKECAFSGSISYYKKSVCEKSGKVAMAEVSYDEDKQAFVDTVPSETTNSEDGSIKDASAEDGSKSKKACCAGHSGKACCKKSGV